jgi:De-etiolated protein 1 Det1
VNKIEWEQIAYQCLFFFVYCLQNSSEEMYYFFEQFYDFFNSVSRNTLHAQFISSHTNNMHALDQLLNIKNKSTSFSQVNRCVFVAALY